VALALTCLLAAALAPSLPAGPAAAVQVAHDRVVSANPADITPRALDGTISSIVTAGDTVIVAGTFTRSRPPTGCSRCRGRGSSASTTAPERSTPGSPQWSTVR